MSGYLFWSLTFDLRPETPRDVVQVLSDVARDATPDRTQLATLHPVVRYYLSDWRRMVRTEKEPHHGTPIRVSRTLNADGGAVDCLSIEFCQHDDEYADGGWVFWLWVLGLAQRPSSGPKRFVGYSSPRRGDPQYWPYFVTVDGVEFEERTMSFVELDAALESVQDDYADYGSGHGD